MDDRWPGIYATRQQALVRALPPNAVLLIGSGEECFSAPIYPSAFRVNSHFFYLTGGRDPGSLLILREKEGVIFRTIFLLTQTESEKRWHAARNWDPSHSDLSHYDHILVWSDTGAIRNFFDSLPKDRAYWLCGDCDRARDYLPLAGTDDQRIAQAVTQLRVIKDYHEQALMRQSIQLSAQAHGRLAARRHDRVAHEVRWQGDWVAAGAVRGLFHQGYMPIIAGGERACCLHYHSNNQSLKTSEFVLVDAGFEYKGYTADITRVYFLKSYRKAMLKRVYEDLLVIQEKLIQQVVVGNTLGALQEQAKLYISQMIFKHQWEEGSVEKILAEDVLKYYPHRVGHHLGIDVHDLVSDQTLFQRPFEPGMVIAIEPGIYIDPQLFDPEHPAIGVGFRIEDDILITASGPEVLSAAAPKKWEHIGAML